MTDPRPRPQYGEYAPFDPDAPTSETADTLSPASPPPGAQSPASQIAQPTAAPSAGSTAGPHAEGPRRRWDVLITSTLLFLGVFDIIVYFSTYTNLGPLMAEGLATQGLEGFASEDAATQAGGILNIVRISILIITIILALRQVQRNRIAFWIPLAGAVLSGIIVVAVLSGVLLSDPAFLEYATSQR
ncbi:DUF6264 family protein [Salinibacterium sp. M195]|uniref:DUF6264 family protein n=1 Tax=Salinibacterium sp. M195 TaxID=2583374 RepID=UPI001C635592|nr:DUF6264 family protein [Salinibacterium sp. M195]QYH36817.1 hypothetical protein FFT87_13210 [Salinibacterium sp. M195]